MQNIEQGQVLCPGLPVDSWMQSNSSEKEDKSCARSSFSQQWHPKAHRGHILKNIQRPPEEHWWLKRDLLNIGHKNINS